MMGNLESITEDITKSEDGNEIRKKIIEIKNNKNIEQADLFGVDFYEKLCKKVAGLRVNGEVTDIELEGICKDIGEYEKLSYTKTNTMEKIETEVNKIKEDKGIKAEPINKWFEENIEEIKVVKSTDSIIDTKYQFKFKGYNSYIESQGEHRSWNEMSNMVFDLTTERVAEPNYNIIEQEKWDQFIDDYISENHRKVEVKGSRTICIEEIKNRISNQKVVKDKERALKNDHIYYDEDKGCIYVFSRLIMSIAENYGLNNESIQSELDNKGVINGSVSEVLSYKGRKYRYWRLPEDFCEFEIEEGGNNILNGSTPMDE